VRKLIPSSPFLRGKRLLSNPSPAVGARHLAVAPENSNVIQDLDQADTGMAASPQAKRKYKGAKPAPAQRLPNTPSYGPSEPQRPESDSELDLTTREQKKHLKDPASSSS